MNRRFLFLSALLTLALNCASSTGIQKSGMKKNPVSAEAGQPRAQISPILKVKLYAPALKKMTSLEEEISINVAVWDLPMDPNVFRKQSYVLGSTGGDVHMKPLFVDADEAGNTPVEFQIQVTSAGKKVDTNLLNCTPVGLTVAQVGDEVHLSCSLN